MATTKKIGEKKFLKTTTQTERKNLPDIKASSKNSGERPFTSLKGSKKLKSNTKKTPISQHKISKLKTSSSAEKKTKIDLAQNITDTVVDKALDQVPGGKLFRIWNKLSNTPNLGKKILLITTTTTLATLGAGLLVAFSTTVGFAVLGLALVNLISLIYLYATEKNNKLTETLDQIQEGVDTVEENLKQVEVLLEDQEIHIDNVDNHLNFAEQIALKAGEINQKAQEKIEKRKEDFENKKNDFNQKINQRIENLNKKVLEAKNKIKDAQSNISKENKEAKQFQSDLHKIDLQEKDLSLEDKNEKVGEKNKKALENLNNLEESFENNSEEIIQEFESIQKDILKFNQELQKNYFDLAEDAMIGFRKLAENNKEIKKEVELARNELAEVKKINNELQELNKDNLFIIGILQQQLEIAKALAKGTGDGYNWQHAVMVFGGGLVGGLITGGVGFGALALAALAPTALKIKNPFESTKELSVEKSDLQDRNKCDACSESGNLRLVFQKKSSGLFGDLTGQKSKTVGLIGVMINGQLHEFQFNLNNTPAISPLDYLRILQLGGRQQAEALTNELNALQIPRGDNFVLGLINNVEINAKVFVKLNSRDSKHRALSTQNFRVLKENANTAYIRITKDGNPPFIYCKFDPKQQPPLTETQIKMIEEFVGKDAFKSLQAMNFGINLVAPNEIDTDIYNNLNASNLKKDQKYELWTSNFKAIKDKGGYIDWHPKTGVIRIDKGDKTPPIYCKFDMKKNPYIAENDIKAIKGFLGKDALLGIPDEWYQYK